MSREVGYWLMRPARGLRLCHAQACRQAPPAPRGGLAATAASSLHPQEPHSSEERAPFHQPASTSPWRKRQSSYGPQIAPRLPQPIRDHWSPLRRTTPCLQSQIGRSRHLRRERTTQLEAAVVLSVGVRRGPVGTAVNGTVVARPTRTTFVGPASVGTNLTTW
jgi:hypothetical protein